LDVAEGLGSGQAEGAALAVGLLSARKYGSMSRKGCCDVVEFARCLGAWLLVMLLLCSCAGPRSVEAGPGREASGRLGPYRMTPLGEGRVQLSLEESPEPLARNLRVAEARRALEEIRRAASALGVRRPMAQRVSTHAGGVEEWERRLWEEFAARYGAEDLPPVEQMAGERVRLALELSTRYMGAGVREAARELFSDPLFVTGVTASLVLYLAAWAAPEPIFSKSVAATVTLWLAIYFTVAELRHAGVVTWRLYQEASQARSLGELEAAAEHFGRNAGASLLRVMVMVVGWGVGKALPPVTRGGGGGSMAMAGGGTAEGMSLASVEVMADGTLVATGVWMGMVAKTAQQSVCSDGKTKDGSYRHHIATARNRDSDVRGGPWTPRFEDLFEEAGMSLEDAANTVYLRGHYGPHPEAYHQTVFTRLRLATAGCSDMATCRRLLTSELRRIAEEICTPGSMLNGLITK
jgi:hypothetical protein